MILKYRYHWYRWTLINCPPSVLFSIFTTDVFPSFIFLPLWTMWNTIAIRENQFVNFVVLKIVSFILNIRNNGLYFWYLIILPLISVISLLFFFLARFWCVKDMIFNVFLSLYRLGWWELCLLSWREISV